ncbi:MAG: hypothetical protein WA431_11185, partial [Candidatus Cybelea sp.]
DRLGDLEDCTCRAGHLSKQMSKLLRAALMLLGATLPLTAAAAPGVSAPVVIAGGRCNSQTIDDASSHLRDYDRHAARGSSEQLNERYGAIADVIATLNEERDVLNSVCSTEAQRALFAQIAATAAWALALEADVAGRLNASCPAAAQALPTMMLSDAWLALANVVNEDGGTVPQAFNDAIPKVQTRAGAVGLTLPAWPETSAYWRDQVHAKAKAAIATCPSPSPSPTP